jgi:hypothetical protein
MVCREIVKMCVKISPPSLRGAKATKQSSFEFAARWIASLALAMTKSVELAV